MPEHRFHTSEPVELDVRVPVGSIEIETVDGEETTVGIEGPDKLVERTVVEQRGRTVSVVLDGRTSIGFGIAITFGGVVLGGGEKLRVRARVPHGSDVSVETAGADVGVRGRVGRLVTKGASTDVAVGGEIERDADVKTVSGSVRLDAVGGDLHVKSVSGDVRAGRVGGSVEIKSVSGDVRVDSVQKGRVDATSVSGDIEIGIAAGTRLDVDAGSVSGDLSSEVPLRSEPEGGAGPTLVVRGKTVSGDFKVFRAA